MIIANKECLESVEACVAELRYTEELFRTAEEVSSDFPGKAGTPVSPILRAKIQNLTNKNPHSPYVLGDDFYPHLSHFTSQITEEASFVLPNPDQFREFEQEYVFEQSGAHSPVRTDDELRMEMLMIGVYAMHYAEQANSCSLPLLMSTRTFSLTRTNASRFAFLTPLKKTLDKIRGRLAPRLMPLPRLNPVVSKDTPESRERLAAMSFYTLSDLRRLALWMEASGDFVEEAKRVRMWIRWWSKLDKQEYGDQMVRIVCMAANFLRAAQKTLGVYTRQSHGDCKSDAKNRFSDAEKSVSESENRSPNTRHQSIAFREDYVLRNRMPGDYHLMMVMSEVMNRSLRKSFAKTEKKVILLPACVRPKNGQDCAALNKGRSLVCRQCSAACQAGRLQRQFQGRAEVRLIPHASDFSAQLSEWSDQMHTGVVASACVAHLLSGGYEMLRQNIPSQCVFLNFSGCKRHWHPQGEATSVQVERLEELLG